MFRLERHQPIGERAETRSSQSPTAVLKDFALGRFETCSITVSKTCAVTTLNPPGSAKLFTASFTATVTNSGASAIPASTVISVTDYAGTPGDTSDDSTVDLPLANPLPPRSSVQISGTFQTNDNPPQANTVTATATIGTTTVLVTHGETGHTHVMVEVGFSGKVCNTGDMWLNVSASDDQAGAVSLSSNLLMPTECATFSGSYQPSSSSSSDPTSAVFQDTVTATGTSPATSATASATGVASCDLCSTSAACP